MWVQNIQQTSVSVNSMYIDKAMKKLLSVSIILSLLLSFSSCISTEIPEETKEHETLSGDAWLSDEAQDSKSTSEEASFTQTEEFAALKKKADEIASSYSATAVQAAVIKNGKLYFTYEYGKADIEAYAVKQEAIEKEFHSAYRVCG